jgi:dihydroneopterin aldolase
LAVTFSASTKCYLYVSDAKVDMLLGQLNEKRKAKLAAELKVSLGILSAHVSSTSDVGNPNRYERLAAAVSHITQNEPVGTVASPAEYVQDCLDVKWLGARGVAME